MNHLKYLDLLRYLLCLLLFLLVMVSYSSIHANEPLVIDNPTLYKETLLKDAVDRIQNVRKGLINWIRPLPIETLNYKPGGKAASIRQLVNHLVFFEMWMIERMRRAYAGEPDLARDVAENFLPNIDSKKASDFLTHGHFADGDLNLDSEGLIKRLKRTRTESNNVINVLKPEDLFKPIIKPADEYHKNILELINHMVYHEFLHRGSILTIRGMLDKED